MQWLSDLFTPYFFKSKQACSPQLSQYYQLRDSKQRLSVKFLINKSRNQCWKINFPHTWQLATTWQTCVFLIGNLRFQINMTKGGCLTFLPILVYEYVPVDAVMEGSSCAVAAFCLGDVAASTTTWLLLELLLRLWLPESRLLLRTPVTVVFSSRGW
jgi:hypothetical protein